MQSSYLDNLNENQKQAVLYQDGPLMIVAGAGSGKTKVLTTRIAHLINGGVDAFRIMALTFTNKAAAEMKERISHILGNTEARNLFIGTFHSVFARILRIEATRLGYPKDFTIYDSDDAKSVLKTIIKELNLDEKHYKPSVVLNRISAAKNNLINAKEYSEDRYIQKEDAFSNSTRIADIYKRYEHQCLKNGAMDFDDLLFKMYELIKYNPDILAKYQNKFRYILIDEYQDTNPAQYQIIKMLGAVHENICVVGDDAQSIYSFRGATIQNILQFKDDYDDVKVIKLEQNYRSTQSILNIANTVIAFNKNQIQKSLWTQNPSGDKINIVETLSDNDEGRFVADTIAEMRLRYHHNLKDFAILYRTNAQSRSFEESLRRRNIPYKIYGGLSFFQRKEVKDFLAYLKLVANERDEENIKRIINFPTRGIGNTSLDRLIVAAREHNCTLWEMLLTPDRAGIKGATAQAILEFVTLIKRFKTMLESANAFDVAFDVAKYTGLVKFYYEDNTQEGKMRYANLQELLNGIKEFTVTPNDDAELEDKSLGSYLQQISLLTDVGKEEDEDDNVVKLMSIHAAKGLEFPCVFAVGLEEDLFPSAMNLIDREGLEEERRLFYVAITRAKEKLWISYANCRYRFGKLINNAPSRFLEELPKDLCTKKSTGTRAIPNPQNSFKSSKTEWSQKTAWNEQGAKTSLKELESHLKKQKNLPEHEPSANFVADNPDDLETGMRVEHLKFGYGKIVQTEGPDNNRIAHIDFGLAHGVKKIMLQYAKLRIVN